MEENKKDQPASRPDPETLHTTDPEEHMKGPISSAMQGIRKTAEDNDQGRGREERPDREAEDSNNQ